MMAVERNFSRKADPRLLETRRDNYLSMIGKLFVRRAVCTMLVMSKSRLLLAPGHGRYYLSGNGQ